MGVRFSDKVFGGLRRGVWGVGAAFKLRVSVLG